MNESAASRSGQGEHRPGAVEAGPGWRAELATLAFFLAAAVLLSWPLAITLDQATGLRGDYFLNLWNPWWMRHVLGELQAPWSTDYLFHPGGLSLQRHLLSPINALAGAGLGLFLGAHASFNVLLILTLAVSGWTFTFFARALGCSRGGAVLGGLLYSFNPFHFYYLCQTNIFTFEFVPLALLAFVRVYRVGRARDFAAVALACAALAASTLHFVVYTYLVVACLGLAGRLLDARVPWREGVRRTLLAALVGALTVALVELPFLLGASSAPEVAEAVRANDLLGFNWVGGPEQLLVSWPTMLGYSTLLFLALTARAWWRARFWLLVASCVGLLSLGETLRIGGEDTGVPLFFGWIARVPGLHMLRSPDRCFMVVELCVALLVAHGWSALAERCARTGGRLAAPLAWSACALAMMVELTAVPLARYEHEPPAYYHELARDPSVEVVLELPTRRDTTGGTVNFHQITHEKKEVLGLVTSYAIRPADLAHMNGVNQLYEELVRNGSSALVDWARANGVDLIVHHSAAPEPRPADASVNGRLLWAPFFVFRRALMGMRQKGPALERPLRPETLRKVLLALQRDLGDPVHADRELAAFRVAR